MNSDDSIKKHDEDFERRLLSYKTNLERQQNQLQVYPDPNYTMYARKLTSEDEYYIEIGDEMIYQTEMMTDEEIIQEARDAGYLDENEEYLTEDEEPDVESLRDQLLQQEMDYPPSNASPSGRAFIFFDDYRSIFPKELKIRIIDGIAPGNDWQGVIVEGIESLKMVQEILYKNKESINFEIKDEIYPKK